MFHEYRSNAGSKSAHWRGNTRPLLAEEGVEHVFGYPGGAVLYIYDAIFKQDKFQHVLVRHEQAAIHAADAYSRSSEKLA
jgi:thiamine pyrophosphate-dependent acetolactate synthase large subunit-like protein